jgi:hypothetical protein
MFRSSAVPAGRRRAARRTHAGAAGPGSVRLGPRDANALKRACGCGAGRAGSGGRARPSRMKDAAATPGSMQDPAKRRTTPAGNTNVQWLEPTPRRWSCSSRTRSMPATSAAAGSAAASTSSALASMRCTPGCTRTGARTEPPSVPGDGFAGSTSGSATRSDSLPNSHSSWPWPRQDAHSHSRAQRRRTTSRGSAAPTSARMLRGIRDRAEPGPACGGSALRLRPPTDAVVFGAA